MMSDTHRSTPRIPPGSVVRAQPVTESSLMDSVAGFITEVQSFNQPQIEGKAQVTWARFEKADLNDQSIYPESMEINGNHPPLLLVLGYNQGVQIWMIPINGEAQELFALKHGQIKALRILQTPENVYGSPDNFAHCRPLLVTVDSTGPGPAFSAASFSSLKSGEVVHNIKFNSEIADVVANRRIVVVSFREKLAAFDACNLEAKFTVTTCYPSPGVHVNPIALGDRWLAYADQRLVGIHRSLGGMESDGNQSVTAWSINVGSKLAQGVSKIYSNFFSSTPSGRHHSHSSGSGCLPSQSAGAVSSNEPQKGVVTILDFVRVFRHDRDEVTMTDKINGVVAHFVAHNKAVVAMEFDANGSLLLTCDRLGSYFNLYKIVPHPAGASYSAVHHLYSLYRGDTPGSVQDIAFSPDSRWVAVSTLRGTTHIFPITPYGGPVGVRTHTSARVVNRLSKFHRSAGLDEHRPSVSAGGQSSSGRSSPNPTLGSSPVFSKMAIDVGTPICMAFPNPHVPPFPVPTIIQPVAQLRQPYLVTLGAAASGVGRKPKHGHGPHHGPSAGGGANEDAPIRLAVAFAPNRAKLVGQQTSLFSRQQRRMNDALYVMANHGVLLEYALDPVPDTTLNKDKICESSPIELQVSAYGQWTMVPPMDRAALTPPLMADNPLMLSLDQLISRGTSISKRDPFSSYKDEGGNEEEKWLSQVEIITHVGPHRRLWMGPQFCFKTFRSNKSKGDELETLDIDKPESSNPVNMPSTLSRQGNVPVLIEAGSASSFGGSFELSPRFSSHPGIGRRGSREHVHQDVESELQEAMSETVIAEESLFDGPTNSRKISQNSSKGTYQKTRPARGESSSAPEEEFFCLTPEDARSMASSGRSRNASSTSLASKHNLPLQIGVPDTKIFSVAVEARSAEQPRTDELSVCDIDTDYTGRFAVVSSNYSKVTKASSSTQKTAVKEPKQLKPVKPVEEVKVEPSKAEAQKEQIILPEELGKGSKGKKNKKKKKGASSGSSAVSSSAEDTTIVKVNSTDLKHADSREVSPPMEEDTFVPLSASKCNNTELLLAEALTDDSPDLVIASKEEKPLLLMMDDEDLEETFSSNFGNNITDKNDAEKKEQDVDDDEDIETPFVIREDSPVSDLDISESKEDKSIEEVPPEVDLEMIGKPVDQGFDGSEDEKGTEIINKIKLAEKIYDDEKSDSEAQKKSTAKRLDSGIDSTSSQKQVDNLDTSDDDLAFQPALSRKQRRKNKTTGNTSRRMSGASFADSESSQVDDKSENEEPQKNQEGWSFEADDLDVNLLIAEVTKKCESTEEKASLEEVFKFDSEMATSTSETLAKKCSFGKISWNMNDLDQTNSAEDSPTNVNNFTGAVTTDESDVENNVLVTMTTSCNVKFNDEKIESNKDGKNKSLTQSLVCTGGLTETTSESSVANSPNPRKTTKKSKKSKKKRF